MSVYVFALLNVENEEGYKEYTALSPACIAKYGGRFFFRNGPREYLEGAEIDSRIVMLQFDSKEQVQRWYDSPEYTEAKKIRMANSTGSLFMFEPSGTSPSA
jgi:uncharacterized protein (DUF1330 family)